MSSEEEEMSGCKAFHTYCEAGADCSGEQEIARLKDSAEGKQIRIEALEVRIETALKPVNPEVDGLIGGCQRCERAVSFDFVIDDRLWIQSVPEAWRRGVLCLRCLDQVMPGLPPSALRVVYATTSLGTVALVPAEILRR